MAVDSTLFTDELIKAIDDWQSGSQNKQNKAKVLKCASSHLPPSYRIAPECVYRQLRVNSKLGIAMSADAIYDPISSWTRSQEVARRFRENDRDCKKVMMIFARRPSPEDVILDLNVVYANPDFMDTVKAAETRLGSDFKGIERWKNTQQEVILEETIVGNDSIIAIGAFRQLNDVIPAIGERDSDAPSDSDIYQELVGKSTDEHFWVCPKNATASARKAAEKCRKFLKEKQVWPKDMPE